MSIETTYILNSMNFFNDFSKNKYYYANDVIRVIIDISSKIHSMGISESIKKIIDINYNNRIISFKSSIIPHIINICPNIDLSIIILGKKIFDICRSSIIYQYTNDKSTVDPVIDIKYVYLILSYIFNLIPTEYIKPLSFGSEGPPVEYRFLSLLLRDNIDLPLNLCNNVVYWVKNFIYIFGQSAKTHIYKLENLVLHCHNCDLTILNCNQISECMKALGTRKKIYVQILLVLTYELNRIYNRSSLQKIENLSDFEDFCQNPVNESLMFLYYYNCD
jgi:hypothetical protein